jgi:RHS repeat-associated protein
LTFSQTLNARQRPETLQLKNGAGATLQSLTYGYSAAGDVTWILDGVDGADTVNNLTYDGLHRLKTANGIWGSYSYTYDGLNNLISRTGTHPLNYGYDAATNRLSNVSGAVSRNYGYNPRGGMIGDGTKSFTLNSNDQITNITGIASYGYDGNGKRIKTTQADGSIEYAIYDQSGALISHALVTAGQNNDYVQLDGRTIAEVLNGVPTYLHPDLLGSPRLGTDANGAIQWQEHFDPYGSKLNGTSEKIGYTGHAYDADTQLTYAQARFYDPAVGRFMSIDPIGFTDKDPFTFNCYSYGNNNPYRHTDPSGMCVEDACVMEAMAVPAIMAAGAAIAATPMVIKVADMIGDAIKGMLSDSNAPSGNQDSGGDEQGDSGGNNGDNGNSSDKPPPPDQNGKNDGLETRGVKPGQGERTIQGQVNNATKNGNPTVQHGGQYLFRLRSSGHGKTEATATPQNIRNVTPDGRVFTEKGPDRAVTPRDIRELYKAQTEQGSNSLRTRSGRGR